MALICLLQGSLTQSLTRELRRQPGLTISLINLYYPLPSGNNVYVLRLLCRAFVEQYLIAISDSIFVFHIISLFRRFPEMYDVWLDCFQAGSSLKYTMK